MDYILSRKAAYRWPPVVILLGLLVASNYVFFPNFALEWTADFKMSLVPKFANDDEMLKLFDDSYATLFRSFSISLMITISAASMCFLTWHMVDIVRHGVRQDPSGARDNVGGAYYLVSILMLSTVVYCACFPTPFLLPGDNSLVRIPMNSFGLFKWSALYALVVGFMFPFVLLDYFNRTLQFFGYKRKEL